MKTYTEKQEAFQNLKDWLKPGDTVYTILRHVSASGMTRHIGLVINRDGAMIHPNYAVSKVLGYRINKRGDGLVISGCGMDMGFHIVHNLGYALFPNGFDCVGKGCPSNDHTNQVESTHHASGGYALHQVWL